jgi:hypothetical protein
LLYPWTLPTFSSIRPSLHIHLPALVPFLFLAVTTLKSHM